MSQTPYSGVFWNLRGNGQFLSLLLAHTSNLPALLPHTKTMPEPAACRCTPRCLDLKARAPHWIQLWGWKCAPQPFLAFNASTPFQKCKLTWKLFMCPFCSSTSMAALSAAQQVTADTHRTSSILHPFHYLQRMQEPGEGINGWTITKLLSGTSSNKNFMTIRVALWKLNLKWRTFPWIVSHHRKAE